MEKGAFLWRKVIQRSTQLERQYKNTKKGNTFVIISISHTPSFNISIILENHELAYIKIDKSLIIIINFSEKIIA